MDQVETIGAVAFATLAKEVSVEEWAKAVAGSEDECCIAQITIKIPLGAAKFIEAAYKEFEDQGFATRVLAHVFSTLLFLGYAKAKGTNVTTIQVSKN